MRDVVVIGGGLSGLAACCELEKHDLRYTIIEVKGNFGGAISSHAENGFITDASAFAMMTPEDPALLVEFGLKPRQFEFRKGTFGFSAGTSTLIEAMTSKLTGGRLLRMAVSSIGRWQKRFTLCLENGMILDAGSVIVAAPARYAERMLFNLVPDISLRLREYHYDTIYRVSLGYHKRDLPDKAGTCERCDFPFCAGDRCARSCARFRPSAFASRRTLQHEFGSQCHDTASYRPLWLACESPGAAD